MSLRRQRFPLESLLPVKFQVRSNMQQVSIWKHEDLQLCVKMERLTSFFSRKLLSVRYSGHNRTGEKGQLESLADRSLRHFTTHVLLHFLHL